MLKINVAFEMNLNTHFIAFVLVLQINSWNDQREAGVFAGKI